MDFPPCDGACPRLVSFFLDRVKISIVSVSVSVSDDDEEPNRTDGPTEG